MLETIGTLYFTRITIDQKKKKKIQAYNFMTSSYKRTVILNDATMRYAVIIIGCSNNNENSKRFQRKLIRRKKNFFLLRLFPRDVKRNKQKI